MEIDNLPYLLHHVLLISNKLECSLEGSIHKQTDLLVYELSCRFAEGFFCNYIPLLREVKGHVTHRIIHSKLDDLEQKEKLDLQVRHCSNADPLLCGQWQFLAVKKRKDCLTISWLPWQLVHNYSWVIFCLAQSNVLSKNALPRAWTFWGVIRWFPLLQENPLNVIF